MHNFCRRDPLRAQTIDVRESAGRILCNTIFRSGGRKLLGKGHVLSAEDVRLLVTEGLGQVWVTELEEGEASEDEAVAMVATEMGCGALEIRPAAGGRANLFASEDCCVLVDDELLRQINCTASVVIATNSNFTFARVGQRVATVKSAPFAVPQSQLEAVIAILREQGPILQARPIRRPCVGLLYTDPQDPERARALFESVTRQRLERFGANPTFALSTVEEEENLARSLQHLLRARPTLILIASTTSPAGPDDAVGRGMVRVGGQLERFLAPVEPGNLFLLAYKDDVPIVAAPGCFRSAKPNILDLVLPPMLAQYRIRGWEVAALGHGGLLG
jgi:molybdenum cofactor cytidylyltransferase